MNKTKKQPKCIRATRLLKAAVAIIALNNFDFKNLIYLLFDLQIGPYPFFYSYLILDFFFLQ
jgi:hypothetical protein